MSIMRDPNHRMEEVSNQDFKEKWPTKHQDAVTAFCSDENRADDDPSGEPSYWLLALDQQDRHVSTVGPLYR